MSCKMYGLTKTGRCLKFSLKICFIANFIPALIMNIKKLKSEPKKTLKKIVIRYIQAACNLAMLSGAGGPLMCLVMKTYGRMDRRAAFFAWIVSSLAVFFEGVSRHVTYAGFFGVRAVEIYFTVMAA